MVLEQVVVALHGSLVGSHMFPKGSYIFILNIQLKGIYDVDSSRILVGISYYAKKQRWTIENKVSCLVLKNLCKPVTSPWCTFHNYIRRKCLH